MELNVCIASPSILAMLKYDQLPVQSHSAYSRHKRVQLILLKRSGEGLGGGQVVYPVVSESVHYMG